MAHLMVGGNIPQDGIAEAARRHDPPIRAKFQSAHETPVTDHRGAERLPRIHIPKADVAFSFGPAPFYELTALE